MSVIQLIFSFFDKIMSLYQILKEFLFTEYSMLGFTFCVWELIGGAGLITILVIAIIKAMNPLS